MMKTLGRQPSGCQRGSRAIGSDPAAPAGVPSMRGIWKHFHSQACVAHTGKKPPRHRWPTLEKGNSWLSFSVFETGLHVAQDALEFTMEQMNLDLYVCTHTCKYTHVCSPEDNLRRHFLRTLSTLFGRWGLSLP